MKAISHKVIPVLIIALALVACGKQEEAQTAAPAQPVAEAAKPAEVAKPTESSAPAAMSAADEHHATGEKVYKRTCAMCHQAGVAGAPVAGKKDEWSARIAQGMPTLYAHAIGGFKGAKGMMPAKGANPALRDEEVKAAVDYMVNKSR